MSDWTCLPRDVFGLILPRDGKVVSRCRAVCRSWRDKINSVPALARLAELHFVHLDSIIDFKDSILEGYNRRATLKKLSHAAASTLFTNILWSQHEVNVHMLRAREPPATQLGQPPLWVGRQWTLPDVLPEKFLVPFGWGGEGGDYFEEATTGDLILINDFYDMDGNDIDPYHVRGMRFLSEKAFPGTFDWRLIQYPIRRGKPDHFIIAKTDFHRGSTFWVRFKNRHGVLTRGGVGKELRKDAKRIRGRRETNRVESLLIQEASTYVLPKNGGRPGKIFHSYH